MSIVWQFPQVILTDRGTILVQRDNSGLLFQSKNKATWSQLVFFFEVTQKAGIKFKLQFRIYSFPVAHHSAHYPLVSAPGFLNEEVQPELG
jgi:hypothetical protein